MYHNKKFNGGPSKSPRRGRLFKNLRLNASFNNYRHFKLVVSINKELIAIELLPYSSPPGRLGGAYK